MSGSLWIGTSGWIYKHWTDVFYPPKMRDAGKLAFYAEHFPTVEVNYSFYRLPDRSVFEQWRDQTPDGFLFAVKGSRYLTHIKRLADPDEPVNRIMERAAGLGKKLGPILFQFPPNLRFDTDRFSGFIKALKRHRSQRFALEFRHESWLDEEVFNRMHRSSLALCLPVGPDSLLDIRLTTRWTYIRMHRGQRGTGYQRRELTEWANRISDFLVDGKDVYVYFNNDPDGHAIKDARRLRELLS